MKEWIAVLVFISIFSFIVNTLLPTGRMKQCANLVFSLILISLILQSICALFKVFDLEWLFNF